MTSEHKPILTNVGVYRSIADAAYRKVSEDMGENVRPRPDGDPGVIKAFDPEQLSFKQAMISVVFTCIWLEATLHLLIVGKHGRKCFREVDKVPYETKLHLLGCRNAESVVFTCTGEFTGVLRIAQDEAENARAVMLGVEKWFGLAD